MRSFWTDRRLVVIPAVALFFGSQAVLGQKGSSPSGSAGAGSTGNINTAGTPTRTPTGQPSLGDVPTNSTTTTRPIFLSGKVMFDDGSPVNTDIRIERVCGGNKRLEAHTDSKGRFSFQVGQNPDAFSDASDTPPGIFGNSGAQYGSNSGYGSTSTSNLRGANSSNPLWNCELRAAYPGYRSDEIDLSSRHSLDDPDVGTLVLHRLGNVQGSTISVTSALAPKPAQKAYEKGLRAAQNGKTEEAEKHLQQATDLYPQYAIAWFALGDIQQREGKAELARKSFLAATTADSKYLSPYDRLAYMAAQQSKWDEAADYSKHVIELNPVEFPTSFWFNALANYQLHKPAEAEKSTAALLKLDTQHHFPQAEFLMAQLLLDKGQNLDAATHLRAYLTLQPNAKNADALKATLLKIEQANAQTKPQTPPQ